MDWPPAPEETRLNQNKKKEKRTMQTKPLKWTKANENPKSPAMKRLRKIKRELRITQGYMALLACILS